MVKNIKVKLNRKKLQANLEKDYDEFVEGFWKEKQERLKKKTKHNSYILKCLNWKLNVMRVFEVLILLSLGIFTLFIGWLLSSNFLFYIASFDFGMCYIKILEMIMGWSKS